MLSGHRVDGFSLKDFVVFMCRCPIAKLHHLSSFLQYPVADPGSELKTFLRLELAVPFGRSLRAGNRRFTTSALSA